jgi:hypothetical protein
VGPALRIAAGGTNAGQRHADAGGGAMTFKHEVKRQQDEAYVQELIKRSEKSIASCLHGDRPTRDWAMSMMARLVMERDRWISKARVYAIVYEVLGRLGYHELGLEGVKAVIESEQAKDAEKRALLVEAVDALKAARRIARQIDESTKKDPKHGSTTIDYLQLIEGVGITNMREPVRRLIEEWGLRRHTDAQLDVLVGKMNEPIFQGK